MFRSEKIKYYEVVMPYASAWTVINSLASHNLAQIIDLNEQVSHLNRPFSNYIRRCEQMTEKLNRIQNSLVEFKLKSKEVDDTKRAMEIIQSVIDIRKKTGDTYFEELEHEILERDRVISAQTLTHEQLKTNIRRLREKLLVLETIKPKITENFVQYHNVGSETKMSEGEIRSLKFCYICGVLNTEVADRFRRMVFRMTRGNAFVDITSIEPKQKPDGTYDEEHVVLDEKNVPISKSIFFIAYQNSSIGIITKKFNKICEAFDVTKYQLPQNYQEFDKSMDELKQDIEQSHIIQKQTKERIKGALTELSEPSGDAGFSYINELKLKVLREKRVYVMFDRMYFEDNIFHAKVWVPERSAKHFTQKIEALDFEKSGLARPTINEKPYKDTPFRPPTSFVTDDFTWPFQEIVHTYGIPRYEEVNPGYFTTVTFPFQYGVMFGDIGHGGLLFLFGIFLVWKNDEIARSSFKAVCQLRWLVFMMGMFAFFNGLIYNEFFGIPLRLFSSCYDSETFERKGEHCVYPFGFDPMWYQSSEEISFGNSFKMKVSIIIGVIHMSLGISMRAVNAIHFRRWVDLVFEFLPPLIFFWVTFGYMCVAIIIKWLINWEGVAKPPPILSIYIGMGVAVKNKLKLGTWFNSVW